MTEDNFPRRRSNFTFIFLITINVFLLTARLNTYILDVKSFLFYILIPTPQAATRTIQITQKLFGNIGEIVRVHQDNLALKKELEKYAGMENEWKQAVEENIRLRALINFPKFQRFTTVKARVISREPDGWFQSILIDRGRDSGVTQDAPVLALAGNRPAVLGRTGEIYANSSKVVLITNVLSAIPALVRPSGDDGLLEGQDNSELSLNYLEAGKSYQIGDEIVTSPLSAVFPSGVLVGKIEDVYEEKDESFKSVTVKPAINLNSLREIMVLVPEK
jgi:rod shape-determining protein MreC